MVRLYRSLAGALPFVLLAFMGTLSAFAVDDSKTFTAGGVIGANLRVKMSASSVVVAGLGDEMIGVNVFDVTTSESANIKLAIPGSIVAMTTAGITTNGNAVYGAASGKISQTVSGRRVGVALRNATGANEIIPVLLLNNAGGVTDGGSTTISSGTGSVKMTNASAANNAVWIPITYGGTTYYVPGWTTNSP